MAPKVLPDSNALWNTCTGLAHLNKEHFVKHIHLLLGPLVLFAAGCVYVLQMQPVKVEGTTMIPALNDGDKIIVDRKIDKLERGDIIVFYFPPDPVKSYIKRIIALPNETIEIRDGVVLINGKVLEEKYLDPELNQSHRSIEPFTLPADNYFVMGDNRDNSSDSRLWGPVERKLIYGVYIKKYSEAR